MKPLVIFHGERVGDGFGGCADGFGAAFAAWLKLGDEAEYLPMQYGEATEGALAAEFGHFRLVTKERVVEVAGRDVYILDFSFPRETTDKIFEAAERVVWLDHHKTAFEMWCDDGERTRCEQTNGRDDVILDNSKSGAMLAWGYFHPGTEVPMLIKHIDDYDRWQFKLDGTKEFNKALWSYAPWSFEQWKLIEDNHKGFAAYQQFISQGAAILRAHDQNVKGVVEGSKRKCRIGIKTEQYGCTSEPGLAANCPAHLTSDVGHMLAKESGTFGLCWRMDKDGKVLCSLRSTGDYDVSALAKAMGGGGHLAAAGFETDMQTLLGWLG